MILARIMSDWKGGAVCQNNSKYKCEGNQPEDDIFDSWDEAYNEALYLRSCFKVSTEELHTQNPIDNDYDDSYEALDFRIIEYDE